MKVAGPAAARIEFGLGGKKRRATTDAVVLPLLPVVPIDPREGWFGVLEARHGVLHVGEPLSVVRITWVLVVCTHVNRTPGFMGSMGSMDSVG